MPKHNNVVPNAHFRKKWQTNVRCWFDQPARKTRRRINRAKKAALIAPRPVSGPLRPITRGMTLKYNIKVKAGRGFTLAELKDAKISRKVAPTIGIAVDHRRKNRSVEGLQANVNRLKEYKARLLVFPKRAYAPKNGDSSAEELKNASQIVGDIIPIQNTVVKSKATAITGDMKSVNAYQTLRKARTDKKYAGMRQDQNPSLTNYYHEIHCCHRRLSSCCHTRLRCRPWCFGKNFLLANERPRTTTRTQW